MIGLSWRRFLNIRQCIFAISYKYILLEKGGATSFKKLQSFSPKDVSWQVWLKVAQWFWRRRFLKILSMYFRYFVIISPWKRAGRFIITPYTQFARHMLRNRKYIDFERNTQIFTVLIQKLSPLFLGVMKFAILRLLLL